MRAERVDNALHFGFSQDDDVTVTQTTSSGVQAEAQTSSSGVQAEARTISSGTQSSKTKMDEFGTQTVRVKTKSKGNQATEDRSEETEQFRQASEIEKQALTYG